MSFTRNSLEEQEVQRLLNFSQEVRRLYIWLWLLTGLSLLSVGWLAWSAYSLKQQNEQMQTEITSLNSYKSAVTKISDLDNRVKGIENQTALINKNISLLKQPVPSQFSNQINSIQNQISSLKTSIQKVSDNSVTPQQMQQTIQKVLQQQNPPITLPPKN